MPAEIRWHGWGVRRRSGQRWECCEPGSRNTAYRGRCICTRSELERAIAGGGAGDTIWADVPAAGDSHHCRQFATSERSGGEKPWHPPGSPGEENAPEENQDACGG